MPWGRTDLGIKIIMLTIFPRHYLKNSWYANSILSINPFYRWEKLRYRNLKLVAQDHRVTRWSSHNSSPGSLTSEPRVLTNTLHCLERAWGERILERQMGANPCGDFVGIGKEFGFTLRAVRNPWNILSRGVTLSGLHFYKITLASCWEQTVGVKVGVSKIN